jgi:hypothetical protein
MNDPAQILKTTSKILLVDWPNKGVPRSLIEAGFAVFGYSPGGYTRAELAAAAPADVDARSVFAPEKAGESTYLVFRKLTAPPSRVDLVHVHRPAAELAGIFASQVIPLGAKALWLQPPLTSGDARALASERGVAFVEGVDIVDAVRRSGRGKRPS